MTALFASSMQIWLAVSGCSPGNFIDCSFNNWYEVVEQVLLQLSFKFPEFVVHVRQLALFLVFIIFALQRVAQNFLYLELLPVSDHF